MVASVVMLVLRKPADVATVPIQEETTYCYISDIQDKHEAAFCETDVNFCAGNVQTSYHEQAKNYEKQFKYKLQDKENLRIEYFVENYIFYIHTLTCYHQVLSQLRRLNI